MTSPRKTAPAAPAPKRKRPLRSDLRNRFVDIFTTFCSITETAEALGINRSQHYRWMKEPEYRLKFEAAIPEAVGLLEDVAIILSRRGVWEPAVYQGEYCYEKRQRTMCKMADGTTAFLDELPKKKHKKILERKTVVTKDGPQIGIFRPDTGLLAKVLAAWLPEKYGNKVAVTGKGGQALLEGISLSWDGPEIMHEIESADTAQALLPQAPGTL